MPSIYEIRDRYPQYSDMSDRDLSDSMRNKFYPDVPQDEFDRRIGLTPQPVESKPVAEDSLSGSARAFGSGVVKGAAGLAGLPGDVQSLSSGDWNPFNWMANKFSAAYPERA